MTEAFATTRPIDHLGLYRGFLERETDASGTVVLHHGRVKRPGKRVSDFSAVELKPLGIGVDDGLLAIARRAEADFALNQVLVVHRLGRLAAGETVLLAVVSGKTRDRCFSACSWIVDEIKKEGLIELTELP